MPKWMFLTEAWKQGLVKQQGYQIKYKLNCYLLLRKDSWKPCPVNELFLSYIIMPNVHILVKTTISGGYLGSTVGGEYVAKPPPTHEPPAVQLQNTGVFLIISQNQLTLFKKMKEPLAWQDGQGIVFVYTCNVYSIFFVI